MESTPYPYYNSVEWRSPCGKLHREDGPAYTTNNGKWYYNNAKLHRLDGPAVDYIDSLGKHVVMWKINNVDVTCMITDWAGELNIDLNNMSDEEKHLIAIKFG